MGKLVAGFIIVSAAVAGLALWYTAERAFYEPVAFIPGQEILLVPLASGKPEPILVEGIEGTDAKSSPIKFRACFTTPLSLAMLSETYQPYPDAVPLNAPAWFDCFDAAEIGAALESGAALAFLSVPGIHDGVDRVVAVFGDGRAYAWHQLADTGEP